ncbi:cytochrome P450 [Irpex rosettiformis]|uniref:Cytochrome P450 n=1 Tax=Irpex rosettiformis TaxID=378272 RepID=A0ACB8TZ79_9APHY|nr:cytochrome P450 [Irpex rosettiformis]
MTVSIVDNVNKLVDVVMADTRLLTSTIFLLPAGMYLAYSAFRRRLAAPGPPRLPLLGNLFQIPSQLQFIRYTEWAQRYGPIFSLDVLGQHIVVLNTYEAAGDLFDRGSNIYNDRPRLVMANEILGGGVLLSIMKSNHSWRRMRRAIHESFNPRAVERYQSIQSEAVILAMLRTIANSNAWEKNLQVIAASSVFTTIYGLPPLETESHLVRYIQEFVARVCETSVPGAYLVDLFPMMKHISASIARWKREGLEWHKEQTKIFEGYSNSVAEKVAKGESQFNFVSDIMASKDRNRLTKEELTWLPGVLILGGTDTTAVMLVNCVLALLHYPNVLRKAQEELDEVIGRERAPIFGDKDNLPYIQAVVREIMRWRPPVPLGVPHMATEDSWYKGYFIPKGALVIGNIWAMNRDRSLYPDFEDFRPERHLDASGKVLVAPPDTHQMGHTSFGFGKRICPGMYFADQELFIGIAMMLWTFDIRPLVDEKGNEVLPDRDAWVDATMVVRSVSFECNFSPRFPKVQEILEAIVPTDA